MEARVIYMRAGVFTVVIASMIALTMVSCGGGPAKPSGPAAATVDDLVGDWSATIVTVTELCYPFTWSARPGGGGVTAPLGPENVGTLTGTLSNGSVSFSLDLPAGSAGPNACAVSGSGIASASQSEIIGDNFRLDFTPACVGILLPSTTNDYNQRGTLTMRKSGLARPACPAGFRIYD